ncbi:MAG: ADP-ribosylglycohydrolase family protein [Chloroflexi bacterium]|nr:ADP-ribosylglycohydrolase family protein [Chloroflexota bacterium]
MSILKDLNTSNDTLQNRARGCLLGAAIGDTMGAPCEGLSAQEIRKRYGALTGFVSDRASGTDDTDFTLFNAHILLTYGVDVTVAQVEAEWRDKLLAPGRVYRPGGFSDVISTRNLAAGLHAPQSGAFGHQMWSDGVAMAIAAAGIICPGNPAQAAQLAEVLGSVSNARDGIYTAQAVAAAISVAMVGATPHEMMAVAIDHVPANSWTYRTLQRARAVSDGHDDIEQALSAIADALIIPWWTWADLATEAVPLAFAIFLASDGIYRRAVPAGIRLGRDADTIGAIVGSLAGAYGGVDAIPASWQARVRESTGYCIGFVANRFIGDIADELGQVAWKSLSAAARSQDFNSMAEKRTTLEAFGQEASKPSPAISTEFLGQIDEDDKPLSMQAPEYERFAGALLGLAYGDAIGFPALFHRFHDTRMPRRRHDFMWRNNKDLDEQRILRLMLPFTHRVTSETLEPCPTDDTEFALLTLESLLASEGWPTQETFLTPWTDQVLPAADKVLGGFSERAAIENMQRGLLPPATGNDNPLHYADAAVPRAVPIGLFCSGDPKAAALLTRLDAQITNAEDGVYAAQAMAVAIAMLAGGSPVEDAMQLARGCLPPGSWIEHGDEIAQGCLLDMTEAEDLAVLLSRRLINTVYSYGNAAPETLPAALAIVEAVAGDLRLGCQIANCIPKAADSLPAMVGALCGAHQGVGAISSRWQEALAEMRGLCLPFLKGVRLDDRAALLVDRVARLSQ